MDEIDFDQDPFGEEFELEDVVNKGELNSDISKKGLKDQVRKDPEFNTRNYSQEDIDQLVNYDQERRKTLNFKSNIGEEIEIDENEEVDIDNTFKDYIVYPRISGNSHLKGDKTLIPESQLRKSSKLVEIVDAPKTKKKHSPATVIVNRDDKGDIDNIEVVCECGDRMLLKFEKADLLDLENLKLETERLTPPIPFGLEDENEEEEASVNDKDKKSKNDSPVDDDDFFSSEKPKEEIKEEEEVFEEEFFEEDFGDDIDAKDLDIDLSGII